MTKNENLGKIGEEMASKYLINKGFKLIIKNYRIRSDEIDIIAKAPDGTLIFCEVKTMRNINDSSNGLIPEDNLTALKYRKMARAAQIFANRNPGYINEDRGWRIDLIAVVLDENNNLIDLRHYENI